MHCTVHAAVQVQSALQCSAGAVQRSAECSAEGRVGCDFAIQQVLRFYDILRFMFPILFKGISKNEENSHVTFNSVINIIFYTLTEVQKLCPSGHLTFRIIVRDISHEC